MLGTTIDPETDGVPGASAQGDDAFGIDDEDAVGAIVLSQTASTTVPVAVTNDTGQTATLAGWMVTEIGRQPWLVTGILRTADAVGEASSGQVGASLTAYALTYAGLLLSYMVVLTHLSGKGAS